MKKVSVIGAGFAGLTVSLRLAELGFQVDLYEKESKVGGLLGTDITEHGIAEKAANALIRTIRAENLFSELNIPKSLPSEFSKKRFIFRDSPKQWPLSIFETLGFIFIFVPKFLFVKSKLHPQENQTLEQWGKNNLGDSATQYLLGPAMQGVYGNEISELSSKLILSGLFSGRREKYKGLLTGPGGMQDLVNHLEKRLIEMNVHIFTNTSVDISTLRGPVILATSAKGAADMLQNHEPQLSAILKSIRMSSLMSVTVFFKSVQAKYKGFGCLVPRRLHIKTLGILMNSYIFTDRNKTYNETWIMGGKKEESLLNLSDEQVIALIQKERADVLKMTSEVLDYRINRWSQALPFYDLNLENAQKELKQLLGDDLCKNYCAKQSCNTIYLHGNYLTGIGLSKILERSELLAAEVSRNHG